MKNHITFDISEQTPYLVGFWFLSYGPNLMDMDRHAHIANQITEFLEGHYLQEDSMDCLGSLAD